MSTTVAISLPPEDLAALDRVCRDHDVSRHDAVQDALLWYIEREGNLPPFEDPLDEMDI